MWTQLLFVLLQKLGYEVLGHCHTFLAHVSHPEICCSTFCTDRITSEVRPHAADAMWCHSQFTGQSSIYSVVEHQIVVRKDTNDDILWRFVLLFYSMVFCSFLFAFYSIHSRWGCPRPTFHLKANGPGKAKHLPECWMKDAWQTNYRMQPQQTSNSADSMNYLEEFHIFFHFRSKQIIFNKDSHWIDSLNAVDLWVPNPNEMTTMMMMRDVVTCPQMDSSVYVIHLWIRARFGT